MESLDEVDIKENTFHDSHTTRHVLSYGCGPSVFSLKIDRPETNENDMITRFYCEFDNYLAETKHRVNNVFTYKEEWIPVTVSEEEIVEQLEAVCVHKSTEYNNWEHTTNVTYSVPSTFEVDEIFEKKETRIQYSLVDGKLYDRDIIYRYSALSHAWLPICPKKIAIPEFKAPNGKIDAKIAPLTIAALTSQFQREKDPKDHYRHRGILHHNSPWEWQYSLPVAGDVFIDLGQPQIVTHIGTVGSFIQTKLYPEHLNNTYSYERVRKLRNRRKYNQGIIVEDDQCSQSWCVSYRLMYKKSAGDPYEYIGNYKANLNSYELVVNDLRTNLPSVPIRYLLLKPISNKPRNFPAYSTCRMSISLYGKAPEVAKKKLAFEDEAKNEVQLIRYTLCVPPVKKVRLKQHNGRKDDIWDCRDDSSKHIIKQRQTNTVLCDVKDFYTYDEYDMDLDSYYDYMMGSCNPGCCVICDGLDWSEYGEDVLCLPSASSGECRVTFDAKLSDTNMWPPLPASTARKGVEVVYDDVTEDSVGESESVSIASSTGISSSYATMSASNTEGDNSDWEYL